MFHPVVKVKVYNEDLVYGPGLVMLLHRIEETGSMKEACLVMGMSYSKGWRIVNRAERELGYPLLIRYHGGNNGGKCMITQQARNLTDRYEKMEKEISEYTKKIFQSYFPEYSSQKGSLSAS